MSSLLQIPAQVTDFRPRADKSYRITWETRELSGDEVALLADSFQGEGWLLWRPNGVIEPGDIPDKDADSGTKTPSQRLRSVIFVLWKQRGQKGDFDSYYRSTLNKLIDYVKSMLEEDHDHR